VPRRFHMTLQRIVQVDAFTDRPFAGNPAAVCVLDQPITDTLMAQISQEMNLAETAFLQRLPGSDEWSLRWFTPAVEVDLCGHATLQRGSVDSESAAACVKTGLRVHTKSRVPTVVRLSG